MDPKVVELPWRTELFEQGASNKKTFAYLEFDGLVMPHPPIQRAIKETVSALRRQGHKVIPWKPFEHSRGVKMINKIYGADGDADIKKTLAEGNEPAIPNIRVLMGEDERPAATITEVWDLQLEKYHYQREYMEHWNQQNAEHGKIDAFIMPVAPHAAVTHNDYIYYGYTSIINLLDYTSVVVPVGFADPAIDLADPSYEPVSSLDKQNWDSYDAEKYRGGPTAVQVVGRRFQEEYVLGLAEQVKSALSSTGLATSDAEDSGVRVEI